MLWLSREGTRQEYVSFFGNGNPSTGRDTSNQRRRSHTGCEENASKPSKVLVDTCAGARNLDRHFYYPQSAVGPTSVGGTGSESSCGNHAWPARSRCGWQTRARAAAQTRLATMGCEMSDVTANADARHALSACAHASGPHARSKISRKHLHCL
jgi:hypothetical protein